MTALSSPCKATKLIEEETRTLVECICHRLPENPAAVILVVGRSGVGKSSLVEDVTDTTGRSANGLDPGTTKCEVAKATINGNEYFFVDTPGFDDVLSAESTFFDLAALLCRMNDHAVTIGMWYVVDIERKRDTAVDHLALKWILGFCGNSFLTNVTFVTTHWGGSQGSTELESRLDERRGRWREFLNGGSHEYHHGRLERKSSHANPGRIPWNEEGRQLLSRRLKEMLVRYYPADNINPTHVPEFMNEIRKSSRCGDTTAGKVILQEQQRWISPISGPELQTNSFTQRDASGNPQLDQGRSSQSNQLDSPPPNRRMEESVNDASEPVETEDTSWRRAPTDEPVPDRQPSVREPSWWDNWRWNVSLSGLTIEYVSNGTPRGTISVSPSDLYRVADTVRGANTTSNATTLRADGLFAPIYTRGPNQDENFVRNMMWMDMFNMQYAD